MRHDKKIKNELVERAESVKLDPIIRVVMENLESAHLMF